MHSLETIELYSSFHPRWFETIQQYTPNSNYISMVENICRWKLVHNGLWCFAAPDNKSIRSHGWKLHISSKTSKCENVLKIVTNILYDKKVPFKFIVDEKMASLVNGKLWPRGSSGKFVTIYPNSDEQFHTIGQLLSEALIEHQGPYILSDRRWPGSTIVYYRYGGFSSRTQLNLDGTQKHVIDTPNGDLITDDRVPYWNAPDWAEEPFAQDNSHNAQGLANGRFEIVSAISFSNRGGVYKGIDMHTGGEVVIKEARPYIEIGSNRIDAIELLSKEFRLLTKLKELDYFVQPIKYFRDWEHEFLVEEFVPGEHLGQFTIRNNPLYSGNVTAEAMNQYIRTVQALWLQIANAIDAAHKNGITLGDLSFTNILVSDGHIRICDLDTGTQDNIDSNVGIYTPGFATSGIDDYTNDWYALGVIILGCFMLTHGFIGYHPPARRKFINELKIDLGLPNPIIEIIEKLTSSSTLKNISSNNIIDSIKKLSSENCTTPGLALPIRALLNEHKLNHIRKNITAVLGEITLYLNTTADTTRTDRLFPADLAVFETNPLSISYGAMGVLYSIKHLSGAPEKRLLDWVYQKEITHQKYPPGLYLGQSGIAWVYSELGEFATAVNIMRCVRSHPLLWTSPNILNGAAGYGLACLKIWKKGAGEEFLEEAIKVGEYLKKKATISQSGVCWPDDSGKVSIGYANGASGIALFLLYLSQAINSKNVLEFGLSALMFDLSKGKRIDGKFSGYPSQFDLSNPDITTGPYSCYWDNGSAGIGTTLIRYLKVVPNDTLQNYLQNILTDATRKYAAFPQLFRGLSGLGNFLLDVWEFTGSREHLLQAWSTAAGTLLYQIECDEGVGFPGDQARRESADFATGTSGIGLFFNRLLKTDGRSYTNFNFTIDELLS